MQIASIQIHGVGSQRPTRWISESRCTVTARRAKSQMSEEIGGLVPHAYDREQSCGSSDIGIPFDEPVTSTPSAIHVKTQETKFELGRMNRSSERLRRRPALKSLNSLSEDFGSSGAVRLKMSRNFSPNLIVIKFLEKINVLFFYYIKLL
jgi:hypothetical protein